MSMICCQACEALIDSDDDPGCFVEPPDCTPPEQRARATTIMCEPCREAEYDRQQESA